MALSKINPTKLSSWKKLVQQFDKENNLHINDFFKEENNRLDEFCINWVFFFMPTSIYVSRFKCLFYKFLYCVSFARSK